MTGRLAQTEQQEKLEITPEMIEAGAIELRSFDREWDDAEEWAVRIMSAILRGTQLRAVINLPSNVGGNKKGGSSRQS